MSERGICSRREADGYIARGLVFVDGERITELGTKVDPDCEVRLDRKAEDERGRLVTILLNKPVGYVSGQPEHGYKAAITLVTRENHYRSDKSGINFSLVQLKGLAPAGRLDIDSTGLIAFTQDGRIAKKLIGEDSETEKEYIVRVEGELSEEGLRLLNHGLVMDNVPLKPANVSWLNRDQLRFILREGKKRQIRRMCVAVGLKVTGLKRVRIGGVRLGDLPEGKWRYLAEGENF